MKEPKTYKLETDLIAKLEELATQSGATNQNDFFDDLARVYEMNHLKEGVGRGYKSLLTEWEYHKNRDHEILVTIIESEAALRMKMTQEHETVLAERNATFLMQEQTIADFKQEMKLHIEEKERLGKENAMQVKQIVQLEDTTKKNNLLLEQYTEKNETLSAKLSEYQVTLQENKELHQQVAELQANQHKHVDRIAKLENDIAALEQQRQEQLQQQQERLDLQRERELVQLKGEYQDKLEKLSAEATERLRAASEESTAEIRKLYSTVDSLREKAGATRTTGSRKATSAKDEGKTQ